MILAREEQTAEKAGKQLTKDGDATIINVGCWLQLLATEMGSKTSSEILKLTFKLKKASWTEPSVLRLIQSTCQKLI